MTELEKMRKRALMRAEHRGMKEMDIILGTFARAKLSEMDIEELVAFEAFMENNDQHLFAAFNGFDQIDPQYEPFLERIRQFFDETNQV